MEGRVEIKLAIRVYDASVVVLLVEGAELGEAPGDARELVAQIGFTRSPEFGQTRGIDDFVGLAKRVVEVVPEAAPLLRFAADVLHGQVSVL